MNLETVGTFVLSLDTEFAWGHVDLPHSLFALEKYFKKTDEAITKFLQLLAEYNISATWAVVTSLLLEKPSFDEELIKRAATMLSKQEKEKYYALLKDKELWYQPQLIKQIQNCSVAQEVGSHSYSHRIFTNLQTTDAEIRNEFCTSYTELHQKGVSPTTFIFPRNEVAHLDELAKAGYSAYRGKEPAWYDFSTGKIRKVLHIFDQTLALTPPVVTPIVSDKLVDIPASMLYLGVNGFRRYIPLHSRVAKAKRGIKRAVKTGAIFHLWFHPYHLATDIDRMLAALEKIFVYVEKERSAGRLKVMTMEQIALQTLAKIEQKE